MIDVKELRIGNYLFDKIENEIVKISGASEEGEHQWVYIEKSRLEFEDEGIIVGTFQGYLAMHFEPIPLTFEIFEQCGFHERKRDHIKHLHQLQNLYFAITGVELVVDINHITLSQPH